MKYIPEKSLVVTGSWDKTVSIFCYTYLALMVEADDLSERLFSVNSFKIMRLFCSAHCIVSTLQQYPLLFSHSAHIFSHSFFVDEGMGHAYA